MKGLGCFGGGTGWWFRFGSKNWPQLWKRAMVVGEFNTQILHIQYLHLENCVILELQMLVNLPAPWSIWDLIDHHQPGKGGTTPHTDDLANCIPVHFGSNDGFTLDVVTTVVPPCRLLAHKQEPPALAQPLTSPCTTQAMNLPTCHGIHTSCCRGYNSEAARRSFGAWTSVSWSNILGEHPLKWYPMRPSTMQNDENDTGIKIDQVTMDD